MKIYLFQDETESPFSFSNQLTLFLSTDESDCIFCKDLSNIPENLDFPRDTHEFLLLDYSLDLIESSSFYWSNKSKTIAKKWGSAIPFNSIWVTRNYFNLPISTPFFTNPNILIPSLSHTIYPIIHELPMLYCVHLKESVDREYNMKRRMSSIGLSDNLEFIDAVRYTSDYILDLFDNKPIENQLDKEKRCADACRTSHLKAMQTFLDSGKDECWIGEDDLMFHHDFMTKYFQVMENKPQDVNLVLLTCQIWNWGGFVWAGIDPTKKNLINIVMWNTWGAGLYWITRKHAQTVIDSFGKMGKEIKNMPPEIPFLANAKGLVAIPPLCIEDCKASVVRETGSGLDTLHVGLHKIWNFKNYDWDESIQDQSKYPTRYNQSLHNFLYQNRAEKNWLETLHLCSAVDLFEGSTILSNSNDIFEEKKDFCFYDEYYLALIFLGQNTENIARRIVKEGHLFKKDISDHYDRLYYNLEHCIFTEKEKTIIIYCYRSSGIEPWDPDSLEKGLPGSEEAVVYLSNELAKYYNVRIYAMPPKKSRFRFKSANPRYFDIESIPTHQTFDVALLWRQPYAYQNIKAFRYIYWPHDILVEPIREQALNHYYEVFWLSEYQRNQYCSKTIEFNKFHKIFGNGITLNKKEIIKQNRYSCIYGSNYARGLNILLECWQDIKNEYPEATLDIYYGSNTWGIISKENEDKIVDKIKSIEYLDVIDHGCVGHKELTEAYNKASIWLYPSTLDETFCITAIRAQYEGCWPIVCNRAALKETVNVEASIIAVEVLNVENYKKLIIETFKKIGEMNEIELLEKRKNFQEFASKWKWESIADKLKYEIEE